VSGALAVFLDRDGTIIEDAGYLRDPAGVRLLPGAAQAIRRLNEHGLIVVVATNQSGIARGLLTLDQYRATERRVDELLTLQGARLDAHYFCPHVLELSGPCDCRKPGSLLYRQAAERFGIDLPRSWWVGDRLRDVLPAETFGGKGILVLTGAGTDEANTASAQGFITTQDLGTAVQIVLREPAPVSKIPSQ
jgi:D-glycero-D-manno-heptose 1,7-bisphosphate phosphatase